MIAALLLVLAQADAGYDGGFYVQGRDVRLTVEGVLQVNATAFERGGPHESEFNLRRMRLEFSGEFFERWLFHVEPKYSADGVELEEAWIGLQAGDHRIMFGRMKEPFSFEEMASLRHMDMLHFSILNQLVPREDHGITVFGSLDILQYQVGLYNGAGGDDTTSDKDVAVRLVLHPWRGLQFGGSATAGRERIDVSGEELRTEARVPWADYLPGTQVTGERIRWGVEAALLEGPFAATAELIRVREELNDSEVAFRGAYLQASYVLTGEGRAWKGEKVRIWKGIKPDRPFLKDPDLGAWQLVARVSRLVLDDDLAPFVSTFPKRIDSVTAGVTWIANDFVKLKLNWLRTIYEDPITINGVRHDKEDALIFQTQVMF